MRSKFNDKILNCAICRDGIVDSGKELQGSPESR